MAHRADYYFKQAVTETELNEGLDWLEQADRALITDQALYGIFSGGAAAQHSPVANLTVDVGGPLIGYDPLGQRVYVPGPTLVVDVSQDSSAVSTTVAGAGNEKWVAITAKFARILTDPRIDGNSVTVYFNSAESYQITVVQGAEATISTAARPALDPNGILICDVNRRNGQTQIFNASIDITRRQDTFVFTGSPLSIRAGYPKDAVQQMLDTLNTHVTSGGHPASAIAYGGGGAWADTTTNPATDAESQFDKIISDLGSSTAGSAKISGAASAGTRFSLSAGTVRAQLVALQAGIDAIRTNGADTIQSFADMTALRALVIGSIPALGVAAVRGFGIYQWSASVSTADNGVTVINPTGNGGPGRWVLWELGEDNVTVPQAGPYGSTFSSTVSGSFVAMTGFTASSAAGVPGAVVTAHAELAVFQDVGTLGEYIMSFQEDAGGVTDVAASIRQSTKSAGAPDTFSLVGTYLCVGTPAALKAMVRARAVSGGGNAYGCFPSNLVMNVRKCAKH